MKKKKLLSITILTGIVIILSLSLFSAETETYPVNKQIDLKFTCTTGGVIASPAATFNITIMYPNGTTKINNQVASALSDGAFNYTTVFPETGLYKVQMFCRDGINSYCVEGYYDITPTGASLSTGNSIAYFLIFIVSFLVFLGLLFLGIGLPHKNERDEMTGYIIAVNNLKYLKYLFIALAYLDALFISYYSYIMCYAYLNMDFLTNIFYFIFMTLVVLLVPLFIVGTYILFANWTRDAKVADYLSRGLSVR